MSLLCLRADFLCAADTVRRSCFSHLRRNIATLIARIASDGRNLLGRQICRRVYFLHCLSSVACRDNCLYFVQFASNSAQELTNYLAGNPDVRDACRMSRPSTDFECLGAQVSDLLITGGDPMVLNSKQMGKYLDSVASDPALSHIQTVRIGSKSLAYWPYKYVTDPDADDMLALLKRVVDSGKHVSLMAHFSHPAELKTPVVREAIRRLRETGIQIRCQAPLINHINNDPEIWTQMWREQVISLLYASFLLLNTGS